MAVEVSPVPEDNPGNRPPLATNETEISNAEPNKLVLSAAERFTMGLKKKHANFPASSTFASASNTRTDTHTHTNTNNSNNSNKASANTTNGHGNGGDLSPTTASSSPEDLLSPISPSSDNPFDFEFKNPFSSKRFHLSTYRKSFDSRNVSSILPSGSGSNAPTANSLSDDDNFRMLQLKSVFNKFFKRKKDSKKGKSADQAAIDAEEYQLWNHLKPLVFQPSAVFMGLAFMIDDKGSSVSDQAKVDWNMNVILALVKVWSSNAISCCLFK